MHDKHLQNPVNEPYRGENEGVEVVQGHEDEILPHRTAHGEEQNLVQERLVREDERKADVQLSRENEPRKEQYTRPHVAVEHQLVRRGAKQSLHLQMNVSRQLFLVRCENSYTGWKQ